MGKPDTNTDLASVLSQATEATGSPGVAEFEPIQVAATPPTDEAQSTAEFSDEPPPSAEPETEAEPQVVSPADAKKSARRIVDFVDNLQKPMLVSLYRRSVLRPGDTERMDSYEKERAARGRFSIEDAVSEDKDFYHVLTRAREFADLVDRAAFTADEKETITGPLAEVLQKYTKLQLTPEMALLLAVAMVMLPRVAPIIPAFRKGFTL